MPILILILPTSQDLIHRSVLVGVYGIVYKYDVNDVVSLDLL